MLYCDLESVESDGGVVMLSVQLWL